MRLIGGILAFAICVLIGRSKAAELNMRQRVMHSFAQNLQALALEMKYRPRDIRHIAEKFYSGELSGFWREFAENIAKYTSAEQAWEQAVINYAGFCALRSQERLLISETGRSIGMLNGKDGIKILRNQSEQAEKYADELKEQSKSKGMVYQKLGWLGGLAVMMLVV